MSKFLCSNEDLISKVIKTAPKPNKCDLKTIQRAYKKNKQRKVYYSIIKKLKIANQDLYAEYTFEHYTKRTRYRFSSDAEYEYAKSNPILCYCKVITSELQLRIVTKPIVSAINHFAWAYEKEWKVLNEIQYNKQKYGYYGNKYSGSPLARIASYPSWMKQLRLSKKLLEYFEITELWDCYQHHPQLYETLAEMKQYKLIALTDRHPIPNGDSKIIFRALRDKYSQLKTYQNWRDYFDYINQLIELKLDYRNPKYAYPKNLNKEHKRLTEKLEKIHEEQRQIEEAKALIKAKADYLKKITPFVNVNLGNSEFSIKPLMNIDEFREEGKEMHHCVYANKYYEQECLIVSIKDSQGKRLETAELQEDKGIWKIAQLRGKCNKDSQYHDAIQKILQQNLYQLNGMTI